MKKELRKILDDYRFLKFTTFEELKKGTNETIDKIFKVFIKTMKKGNKE